MASLMQRIFSKKNCVTLVDYHLDLKSGSSKSVYFVRHDSKIWKTVLEQKLEINIDEFGKFIPIVHLDDFPRNLSERESMLKLADWLHRISVSIEDHWSQP